MHVLEEGITEEAEQMKNVKASEIKAGLLANLHYFFKWLLISVLIGSIGGVAGTIFSYGVAWATDFRLSNRYMLFYLPAAGLLIIWM